MNWRDVRILYTRELRSALRERTIVVNSILMPVFLYPVLLWVMFTAMAFVQGMAEGFTSRIVILDPPVDHPVLVSDLEGLEDVTLVSGVGSLAEGEALLRAGDLDALAVFRPSAGDEAALAGNFVMSLRYDRAVERSVRARDRLVSAVEDYRTTWMDREARGLGIEELEERQFQVAAYNVSTERAMGALLLGSLVPLFLVIMVAVGCFVPSVDTTAGERERSTWETLMTVSASRLSMVVAKYLYVATLGITAGVLNVLAVFVSIGAVVEPLLGDANEAFQFSVPLMAIPVMMLGAVALALFFAATMMILAAFARTFKDGQAMVTPAYWLALLPLVLGQQTDRTLTPVIAAIPVANIAMMIRDALNGIFLWPYIVETLAVILVLVAGALLLARTVLRFEDFIIGSYDGSIWRFMRERWLGGRGRDRATGSAVWTDAS